MLAGVTPSMQNNTANSVVTESANLSDQMYSINVDYRIGGLTLSSTTAFLHEHQFNYQDLFVNSSFYSNSFRDAFSTLFWAASPGRPVLGHFLQRPDPRHLRQSDQPGVSRSLLARRAVQLRGRRILFGPNGRYGARAPDAGRNELQRGPDTKTYDIYGRSTWRFLPSTSLVTGLRYNGTSSATATSSSRTASSIRRTATTPSVVGDISLQQKFTPSWMVYATYARGYAPKVFNTGPTAAAMPGRPTAPLPATGQEHIDNFESARRARISMADCR